LNNSISILFPSRTRVKVRWRNIHELFEDVTQDRQAVNIRLLTGGKEPVFPLFRVTKARRRTRDAYRQEKRIQGFV
jgi:hypothetical protein